MQLKLMLINQRKELYPFLSLVKPKKKQDRDRTPAGSTNDPLEAVLVPVVLSRKKLNLATR